MNRIGVGAGVGAAAGLALLAVAGGVYGYAEGVPTARVPPGPGAAVRSAFIATVWFGWLAVPLGAAGGGLVAAALRLVARPRA
jgi:hypothetical protein